MCRTYVVCVSGPGAWGVMENVMAGSQLCKMGRNQSPINIDPATLLYDPHLGPFKVESARVRGPYTVVGCRAHT